MLTYIFELLSIGILFWECRLASSLRKWITLHAPVLIGKLAYRCTEKAKTMRDREKRVIKVKLLHVCHNEGVRSGAIVDQRKSPKL